MIDALETKVFPNGLTVKRIKRIHSIRYEITDRVGQIFIFSVNPTKRFIYSSFITEQMKLLGFEEVDSKAHNGKLIYRITSDLAPINRFIVYPDIIKLSILSANASTYTYKEKACEAIANEAAILSQVDDKDAMDNSIRLIKECLRGIEENWEISNDF